MIRCFLILFCFVFLSQVATAQSLEQQTDSLLDSIKNTSSDSLKIEGYFNAAQLHLYSEPLKTIDFCRKAINIGKKAKAYLAINGAYTLMFNANLYYGAPADTLLQNIKLQEENVTSNLGEKYMLYVHWIYALYYNNILQDDKQIEAYIKALELAKVHYDRPDLESSLMGNIGAVLLDQGKDLEAKLYFEKGLEIVRDDIARGVLYHNLARVYEHQEKYDSALIFYKEAYHFNKKGKDYKGMAEALIGEGKYYDQKKDFERANAQYLQSLNLIKTNNIGSLLPLIYTTIAEHYEGREEYQVAINYGLKALEEINNQQNYEKLSSTYDLLHKCYAAIGEYQRAYEIRGKQLIYQDSIKNSELLTNIEALKTEFEVEQKETENELLKAETASNQKTIQNRNIAALALLLGLLLLGSWAVAVFRSSRRKQRYNEVLEATVAERTSELKKVNKDLAQANYELKTFNYIASHDIKEPIRIIGSYAGLVYRKLPKAIQFDFKEHFDNIKRSTTQLYTLMEDFSRYTKLSKSDDIEIQLVDLNALVDGLKMNLSEFTKEKNARIINKGLPRIQTNSSLLYTILKNITENGLKFNQSANPTVTISAKEHEKYTEIFLADNGIGIDPAYQEQIFNMFKRLHHRQEFKGSGMGLATAKLLMDKLGASVEMESEVNQGSTFILRIPRPVST